MTRTVNARRRSLLALAVLLAVPASICLALPGAANISHRNAAVPAAPAAGLFSQGPVHSMVLPHEEMPHVPYGPNREQFAALCRLCHSPRFVLTQPPLTETKWAEVVHKMVATYGAPVPAEQEKAIVDYLVSVRGAERKATRLAQAR